MLRSSRHDLGEEQLGLAEHRLAERLVEVGIPLAVGAERLEVPDLEPLAGEVIHQGPGPGIDEHPTDLAGEHLGRPQLPLAGQAEERVVRHAAPEEVREPGGQLELADRLGPRRARPAGAIPRGRSSSSTRKRK